jgi:dTDP-4-dehydrorhamnose reductase
MRVLVLGASGMLGHTVYRVLAGDPKFEVFGTLRSDAARSRLPAADNAKLISGVDTDSPDALLGAFVESRPDAVINCVGVIKQLKAAYDPLVTVPINSILPHRLARMAAASGGRLVHVSTDCVFTGAKGNYVESDAPDAQDLYGRSKLIGEVDQQNAVTLRTSIIGPELGGGGTGLVGWFLNQSGKVKGYRKAIFSGFPTVTLARLIRDKILPKKDLHGLYHASVAPIDKFSLLTLVREIYGKKIEIEATDDVVIDRSLNSDRLRAAIGYAPPSWPELVKEMHAFG